MTTYKIQIKPSALKELSRIHGRDQDRIVRKIKSLEHNPRPSGCEKLTARNAYRVRQGLYRIIYQIEDDILIVLVIKIGHRRDVYERP